MGTCVAFKLFNYLDDFQWLSKSKWRRIASSVQTKKKGHCTKKADKTTAKHKKATKTGPKHKQTSSLCHLTFTDITEQLYRVIL